MLTALQGQPVVHVTFSVEARLEVRAGGERRGQDGGETQGSMSELIVLRAGSKPCFPVLGNSFFAVYNES